MLRDRYEPMNLFEYIPTLSMQMDPILTQIDRVLDDDTLFQAIKADLARRHPRTLSDGRPSTPVEVILRMLVIKHLYGWSDEQVEQFVADSLVLRQFCRIYAARVPDDTTVLRWAKLIQPATLHQLLDHVVDLACQLKVTQGRKLRIDGTVVETHVHHPTDSTLLNDGVRVLSRGLGKVRQVGQMGQDSLGWAQEQVQIVMRQARESMKQIMQVARQRGEQAADHLRTAYRQLIDLTQTVVDQARQSAPTLHDAADAAAQRVAVLLDQYVPLVEQVIQQAIRRVLQGEQVPASEKIVSLFEPHTAIIRKGKPGQPTEFGRCVWLDEVEGGIISRYAVLTGNPDEQAQLPPSLEHHITQFGHPPDVLAGDRGVHSPTNERYATKRGVKQVVLPKPGKKSAKRFAHEQQDWFVAGRNWRAGIEGRISGLKRRHGLERCRYHGDAGMERWVGWGVISHDLRMMAQVMAA